jgi:molybdate transport system substrate-binding protein
MVHILSAGACKGLFSLGGGMHATFGAVGAMQEKLLAGEPCDLLVLTLPMLQTLAAQGKVLGTSIRALGQVGTGIAVPADMAVWPDVSTPERLAANLAAASRIHFPDPAKATAGIHFQRVLEQLGIAKQVAKRVSHYPNGATAMGHLGRQAAEHGILQIGCTQVSEILYTPSVRLVAELPEPFILRTTYAAALTPQGQERAAVRRVYDMLTGKPSLARRQAGGFHI